VTSRWRGIYQLWERSRRACGLWTLTGMSHNANLQRLLWRLHRLGQFPSTVCSLYRCHLYQVCVQNVSRDTRYLQTWRLVEERYLVGHLALFGIDRKHSDCSHYQGAKPRQPHAAKWGALKGNLCAQTKPPSLQRKLQVCGCTFGQGGSTLSGGLPFGLRLLTRILMVAFVAALNDSSYNVPAAH